MTHQASIPAVRVRLEKDDGQVVEQTFAKPFSIGRAAGCQVQVAVKSVSRMHALVVFEDGQWWVQDVGSINGLYVEGQKVQQAALREPLELSLGPSGPHLHFSIADPEPEVLKQAPALRAFFEPKEAPSSPPAVFWPSHPERGSAAPPPTALWPESPPAEIIPPEPPPRTEPVAPTTPHETAPALLTPYRANRFTLPLYEDWIDKTEHILSGPVADGLRHNIIIHVELEVSIDALYDYAEAQLEALKAGLTAFRLLKSDRIQLAGGMPAYRAIFVWQPPEDDRLYQEQLYVLHRQTGYTLTATFTRKTRKALGAQIEQVMLHFTPQE